MNRREIGRKVPKYNWGRIGDVGAAVKQKEIKIAQALEFFTSCCFCLSFLFWKQNILESYLHLFKQYLQQYLYQQPHYHLFLSLSFQLFSFVDKMLPLDFWSVILTWSPRPLNTFWRVSKNIVFLLTEK